MYECLLCAITVGSGALREHLGLLQQSSEVALLSSLVCVGAGI